MIELHTWNTQNARKVSIMLEECAIPYRIVPVDLLKGEQRDVKFLALNANGKIPVIVDTDGSLGPVTIGESGAILFYLAEKSGRFLPAERAERYVVMQWLFWQMSAIGPAFGNLAHFGAAMAPNSPLVNSWLRATMATEVWPYPIKRFLDESMRLVGVLESLLKHNAYIAGELSIADFATIAWIESSWAGLRDRSDDLEQRHPHVMQWRKRLLERPALQRGLEVLAWERDLTKQEVCTVELQ